MRPILPDRCAKLTITYLDGRYINTHTGWLIQDGWRVIDTSKPHRTVCHVDQITRWRYAR